jgi:hypothetical protein
MNPHISHLRLQLADEAEQPCVTYHVDGDDFGARLRVALGPAGFDDGLPWPPADAGVEETVLGGRARRDGATAAILLACGCGYSACSSVTADVTVASETITLSNFTTWWAGARHVAPIAPITFDRHQFDLAVRDLHALLAARRPPPPVIPPALPPRVIELPPIPNAAEGPTPLLPPTPVAERTGSAATDDPDGHRSQSVR